MLLLPASFSKLLEMLNICHTFVVEWHISFNLKKSHIHVCAFRVKSVKKTVLCMAMNIPWCNKFQYLGVMRVCEKSLNVGVKINRTKFLVTAYAILNRCDAFTEKVKIQLISSQSVPILLYGMECFNFTVQ